MIILFALLFVIHAVLMIFHGGGLLLARTEDGELYERVAGNFRYALFVTALSAAGIYLEVRAL